MGVQKGLGVRVSNSENGVLGFINAIFITET